VREIDFEEDEWIHDNQYVIVDEFEKRPDLVLDFKKLKEDHLLDEADEILI
jgi:uncharacterized protein YjiK